MACKPPLITSAIYADENKIIPITALKSLSTSAPEGRNKGIKTEAANKTVIRGIPLQNSINIVHNTLATGISDLLPKANRTPKGREATIPVMAIRRVKRRPPQSNVSIGSKP